MKSRILVIDDEAEIRRSVRMILEYEGYEVIEASSGPEGIALAEREAPDLVFLDIKMPGMDGLEVLQRLRGVERDAAGRDHLRPRHREHRRRGDQGGRVRLHREAARRASACCVTIRNALDQTRLRDENRSLKRAVEVRHQMVGESPALRQVWDAIKRAAPTNATVLLLGESGVGKELVARSIHRNSLRSRERFVQVNCAAIPEELIESELFGHEKGSFTGATEKQIGKFEQADRGTIFLDEVGDMSAKTQAKVLRVLQEGEVERLGSARTIKVDVRVIAATNKDLEEEIEKGTFREDLYFRLSVIPIRVPPLRERREDIPALVRHFADLFSRENNRRPQRFTPAALEYMQKARWKGNVRELKNTVERLIIMTPRRRRSTSTTCATSCGLSRSRAAARERQGTSRHAARVQGVGRARVPRRQAARERLEHLEDRRGDRHAAQQSVQEARAVRDQPGRRRIGTTRSPMIHIRRPYASTNRHRRSRPDDRRRRVRKGGGRKVRTPQGSAPGNARSGQPEGKWHRKYTAFAPRAPEACRTLGARRAKAGKGEKVR